MTNMSNAYEFTTDLLPPRRALVDDVYDALLTLLMDQVIKPGSRASIDGLARMLNVSPTPVREALTRLEAEGLVTKQTLKGYTAAELLDAEGLRQLYEMRSLLEPEGARLAATRLSPSDLKELESLALQMHAEAKVPPTEENRYESYRTFAERDAAFHRAIVEHSGNTLLSDAVIRLRSHIHLYRLFFQHGIEEETSAEHDAILDALREGDAESARAAMQDHIAKSHARMAELFS